MRSVRWSESSRLPEHVHVRARIVVALDGTFRESREGTLGEYGAATAIVRPAGERHADEYGSTGGCYVRLAINNASFASEIISTTRDAVVCAKAHLLGSRLLYEIGEDDQWSTLSAVGLAYEIIAAIGRRADSKAIEQPRWIAIVVDLLREEHRTTWTLAEIARRVDVEPARLSRAFRRYIGHGIGDELRRVRVEIARRAIATSDASLAQIAADAGFADQSHLTRAFRRVFGTTPSTYRRSPKRTIGSSPIDPF